MHIVYEHKKSISMSNEIFDRDEKAKMLII